MSLNGEHIIMSNASFNGIQLQLQQLLQFTKEKIPKKAKWKKKMKKKNVHQHKKHSDEEAKKQAISTIKTE